MFKELTNFWKNKNKKDLLIEERLDKKLNNY